MILDYLLFICIKILFVKYVEKKIIRNYIYNKNNQENILIMENKIYEIKLIGNHHYHK